ncbi:helix-turn-helix domain-containing protein [Kocuria sp. U4B]
MDKLLTVDEVAEILRKTPGALRYQIHAGTAPRSARIMGRRMFRESDVRAYIEAQFAATA